MDWWLERRDVHGLIRNCFIWLASIVDHHIYSVQGHSM